MRERVLKTLTGKPWSFAVALTIVLLIANQLAQSSFGRPSCLANHTRGFFAVRSRCDRNDAGGSERGRGT